MSYHFSFFLYFIPLYASPIYSVSLNKTLQVFDELENLVALKVHCRKTSYNKGCVTSTYIFIL
jgi:hypothetical protein